PISSVARVVMASRATGAAHAFALSAEAGSIGAVEPAAQPPGTAVEVDDLYYNTPARRKFLKSDATEFAHCEAVFTRAALSRPDITYPEAQRPSRGAVRAHRPRAAGRGGAGPGVRTDRKSTRLNSSHVSISHTV